MLKFFFLIATLATLAQSQIAVEWICEDTKSMGNCSRVPKMTDLLQIISQNSDDYEYTDYHYCPNYIVERHIKCVRTYFDSCYRHMTPFMRNIFLAYVPLTESAETFCDKNRPYKKEFREHMSCTKALLEADDDWEDFADDAEMQYGQSIDDMTARSKCKVVSCYWRELTTEIRKQCGPKTEKFSRQVLSYMWPISMLSKLCDELLIFGPL
ncbi:uncharacterized protein LOC132941648 isoform X2 [Metopolophium dirhodum]|uniref:uncharacterized protein LOC132941648 isoform X2 n=1 Tax=Metopolophium dirhodum TaxID=44670 RepID=UPI0029902273|nr:uncharacterized protein LOC132941648 isoform X2 [Metopolophium dirhodum]